jgi:hypothetical protein
MREKGGAIEQVHETIRKGKAHNVALCLRPMTVRRPAARIG